MISCVEYVNKRKQILKERIERFKEQPCLVVIQVGDDPASSVYVKNKKKLSEELGIKFEHTKLEKDISEIDLIRTIDFYNRKCDVDGIIVQLPLPEHLDAKRITETIAVDKDVDGFRHDSLLKPCTPKGIINWLIYNKINLADKTVCVIGRSDIVGKPLVDLLIKEDATVVWCHSKTKFIRKHSLNADIVISAIGKPNYFDERFFNPNQIIVDVGINRDIYGRLCGDVCESVSKFVEYKTPVPNGVGKLTVLSLMENVVEAHLLSGGV